MSDIKNKKGSPKVRRKEDTMWSRKYVKTKQKPSSIFSKASNVEIEDAQGAIGSEDKLHPEKSIVASKNNLF